jgi:hypothetical protein
LKEAFSMNFNKGIGSVRDNSLGYSSSGNTAPLNVGWRIENNPRKGIFGCIFPVYNVCIIVRALRKVISVR